MRCNFTPSGPGADLIEEHKRRPGAEAPPCEGGKEPLPGPPRIARKLLYKVAPEPGAPARKKPLLILHRGGKLGT